MSKQLVMLEPAPNSSGRAETENMRQRLDKMSIASLVAPSYSAYSQIEPSPRAEPAYLNCAITTKKSNGASIVPRRMMLNQPLDSSAGSSTADLARDKSKSRPVYTEEQKFFIMYARIVLDLSWTDVEDRFSDIFGHRSKDGITSMYYRIRKSWGLKDILKAGPDSFPEEKQTILERASYFSEGFLSSMGYCF